MRRRRSGANDAPSTVWLPEPRDAEMAPPSAAVACDVAVIGGGLSGLSMALHLKQCEPGWHVALFEAARIGYGASGRSSGQCAPRIGPAIERQARALGDDVARAAYLYSVEAVEFAGKLVRDFGIDCDCRATGQWQVALRERDALALERRARTYRRLGLDVPLLGAETIRRRMPDSDLILNALGFPALQLNPGLLCIGLKRAARELGVSIFERTPVSRFDVSSGTLQAGGVTVRAARSVVAVDGVTSSLGIPHRNVLPILAHAAVTAPLTAAQQNTIGWRRGAPGLFDARPAFNFLRPMAGGRLLIGGEYRYAGRVAPMGAPDISVAANLAQQLTTFFPSLSGMPIERAWQGVLGCTFNEWPVVRPLDSAHRHWHIGAWNGHGIALSLNAGRELAECMTGRRPPPRPWPRSPGIPEPLARFALPIYLAWLRRASRLTH